MIKALGTNHINSYRNSFRGDSTQTNAQKTKSQPSEKFKAERKCIYTYAYSIAGLAAIAAISFATIKSLHKQLDDMNKQLAELKSLAKKVPIIEEALKKAGINIIT